MNTPYWDKPMAAAPYKSYRYMGNYGWIMVGAHNDADALKQAQRSLSHGTATLEKLQAWNGAEYVPVAQSAM